MNPFTQTLLAQLEAPPQASFVAAWDQLEALVIGVFRAKRASEEVEAGYARLRAFLWEEHARWAEALVPFWQRAKVKGRGKLAPQKASEDPFVYLLRFARAEDFAKSRDAFLMLPAAREALNTYLLAEIEAKKAGDTDR